MASRDNFFRTSDETILYFEDHSPEKGNPIVLVPGFCCSAQFYENNIKVLKETNRVITFDPRGQGRSQKVFRGTRSSATVRISRNCWTIWTYRMRFFLAGRWQASSSSSISISTERTG